MKVLNMEVRSSRKWYTQCNAKCLWRISGVHFSARSLIIDWRNRSGRDCKGRSPLIHVEGIFFGLGPGPPLIWSQPSRAHQLMLDQTSLCWSDRYRWPRKVVVVVVVVVVDLHLEIDRTRSSCGERHHPVLNQFQSRLPSILPVMQSQPEQLSRVFVTGEMLDDFSAEESCCSSHLVCITQLNAYAFQRLDWLKFQKHSDFLTHFLEVRAPVGSYLSKESCWEQWSLSTTGYGRICSSPFWLLDDVDGYID